MENNIQINKNNELSQKNIIEKTEQKDFLETTLGKAINTGFDIGLRILLPDLIENQVIDIKNTIIKEGFQEGIKKVVSSAVDLGKSTIGIFTGNFENISQVQTAVKNGGIIDGISKVMDFVIEKVGKQGIIPMGITNTIKQGKNVILNNITNHIENEFNKQMEGIEKIQKYTNNWNTYYQKQNYPGMEKEYKKLVTELKKVIPLENILKEARKIENLHMIIKNNGKNFNITKEQKQLAEILT